MKKYYYVIAYGCNGIDVNYFESKEETEQHVKRLYALYSDEREINIDVIYGEKLIIEKIKIAAKIQISHTGIDYEEKNQKFI